MPVGSECFWRRRGSRWNINRSIWGRGKPGARLLTKNPAGRIPVLELDDGTCLSETLAICRYFEELHPEPNLFGSTALERATIEMWSRFIEFNLWLPTGMAFRHITGFTKTGSGSSPNGEECKQQAQIWFDKLDARLAEVPYIAGNASPSPTFLPSVPLILARWLACVSPPNSPICRTGMTG